jgi:DNA-binding XRE family transcriptional regulator
MRNRLQAEREARAVSTTDLARHSGVSRQTIYTIESDSTYEPMGASMARLATALGCEIGDLFQSEPAQAAAS